MKYNKGEKFSNLLSAELHANRIIKARDFKEVVIVPQSVKPEFQFIVLDL